MATLQNLYNNIKTLITKYFEEKTIEDETLPELIESCFNYNQGKLNIDIPHMELTVTGSSFETYSSTPFTYTGAIFVDWGDNTDLIEYTDGKLSHSFTDGLYSHTIKVYGNLTVLRVSCFKDCTGLTSITLPDSVTTLRESCFNGCTGLTSITLPDSITTLRESCFNGCTGLTSITLPDSVISLEASCFKYCTGLTSITIPSSVTSLGHNCFNGCTGLTSITLPDSISSLGAYCFYNCTGLTSANIPSSVTSLGGYCFEGCTGLTSINLNWNTSNKILTYDSTWINKANNNLKFNIPNGTTSLYTAKDYPSDKLVEIDMELTVTGSSFSTFSSTPFTYTGAVYVDWGDSSGLVEYTGGTLSHTYASSGSYSVKIYGNITSLGNDCFQDCTGLTSITLPDSVTSLGNDCFLNCAGLTSVTLPNSITSLGEGCFLSCDSLTSITLSDSVTSLGEGCFYHCTGLTSITIPNSVTSLGNVCFLNCTGLTELVLLWDSSSEIVTYNSNWIDGCTSFNYFLIPRGTTSLYTAKSYPSNKLVESD